MVKHLNRKHVIIKTSKATKKNLLPLLIASMIVMCGFADLPRGISLGPITALAALTVIYNGVLFGIWITRPVIVKSALLTFTFLTSFIVWAATSLVFFGISKAGLQNLAVFMIFLGMVLVCSSYSYKNPAFARVVERAIVSAAWLGAVIYITTLLVWGSSSEALISARGFALLAALGVACHLSNWRQGARRELWAAILLTALIGVSLSRIALFAALILFPLSRFGHWGNIRHIFETIVVSLTMIAAFYLAVLYVDPLNERFFSGDVYSVGDFGINVTGRDEIWSIVLGSAMNSPIIGQGAGSANNITAASFGSQIAHPHNEYLRIFHDYGFIGLVMFLTVIWGTLLRCYRWTSIVIPYTYIHWAASLALIATSVAMLTSNILLYVFVMAPLGALVGVSLGLGNRLARLGIRR